MKKRTVRRVRTIIYTMIVLVMLLTVSHIESHYKKVATVDSINGSVITFVDTLGYTWEAEDVLKGHFRLMWKCKMNKNETVKSLPVLITVMAMDLTP